MFRFLLFSFHFFCFFGVSWIRKYLGEFGINLTGNEGKFEKDLNGVFVLKFFIEKFFEKLNN